MSTGEITQLLKRSEAGDDMAAGQLIERIYADLRRIARARLRNDRTGTLGTTALVHEAWLAMTRPQRASFGSRSHYFAYAAKAMRHILVDRSRRRSAGKRQPGVAELPAVHEDALGLLALDQALGRLGGISPRLAQVVELRLFAGMSGAEVAALLGVTERTIERDWLKARALLAQWIDEGP